MNKTIVLGFWFAATVLMCVSIVGIIPLLCCFDDWVELANKIIEQ